MAIQPGAPGFAGTHPVRPGALAVRHLQPLSVELLFMESLVPVGISTRLSTQGHWLSS